MSARHPIHVADIALETPKQNLNMTSKQQPTSKNFETITYDTTDLFLIATNTETEGIY